MSDAARRRPDLAALSDWGPELAQTFVSLASDIALILDRDGVITSVAQGSAQPFAGATVDWVGLPWVDIVTGETRSKVELLLKEVAADGLSRRREVNHTSPAGISIPVAYTAIRLGEDGPVLAVGRDLRAVAAIQQRFLDVQQDLERSYWQARQAEARAGLLTQVATDAVLVVDAATSLVLEVNPFASQLFDLSAAQLIGRAFILGFERHSRPALEDLLVSTARTGRGAEISARLAGRIALTSVAATPLRIDDRIRLLVRVRLLDPAEPAAGSARAAASTGVVVVTDSNGRVRMASPAFVSLVRADSESVVIGRSLKDWLDGTSTSSLLPSWLQRLRRDGVVRGMPADLRTTGGQTVRVEWSAMLMPEGDRELVGFIFEPVAADSTAGREAVDALRDALDLLCDRVGQDGLLDLLDGVSVLAERHFMQLALTRAGGDAEAAARLLRLAPEELERRRRRSGEAPSRTGPD